MESAKRPVSNESTGPTDLSHASSTVLAYVAEGSGQPFAKTQVRLPALADDEVEVTVEYCGLCHSDLSMWMNEWGKTRFPFVGGHEIIGRVTGMGSAARGLQPGQRVGIGWYSGSCLTCGPCRAGDLNHCQSIRRLIADGYGGFAQRVRCHWAWAIPLPEALDPALAGPLFCGGLTVFSPIYRYAHPTHRVGVVGIGGLGHLAVRFLRAFGCEVSAFVGHESQITEALELGAHRAWHPASDWSSLRKQAPLDLMLITTSAALDWRKLMQALGPRGQMHFLGMGCDPIPVTPPDFVGGLRMSGSPLGRPEEILKMLEFCTRHRILPQVEHFPLSQINQAFEHLRSGKPRYRIVLHNDLG